MRSPLQVAIMTALVDRFGQPPHERWSLFHRYYEVIYQRERERDTDAAPILSEYEPDINAIHQRVGLTLQLLTTREEHSDPRLSGAELARIVDARLGQEGHTAASAAALSERIRSAAELRLVFLVEAQEDRIGFEIRSLQEFMAAGALVDGLPEDIIPRLHAIAPLPSWRNVLMFALGECFVRKQELRGHIHNLCRSLDVEPDDPLLGPVKAGARLALDLLEDRVARHQPKQRRLIAAHALEALDVADPAVSIRLARCYDDELDDLYRAKLADCVAGSDAIRRNNGRRCLAVLAGDGVAWASSELRGVPPRDSSAAFALLHGLPRHSFDALDKPFAARCISVLDARELGRLADGGWLERLFDDLRWASHRRYHSIEYESGVDGLTLDLDEWQAVPPTPGRPFWSARDVASIPPSPTLAVLRAAEAFAGQPTMERLAESLEHIAASSTPAAWHELENRVPWPMGMLLARATTSADLLRLRAEVREDRYGGPESWTEAELRWQSEGVRLDRDRGGSAQPFPLEVTGWSYAGGSDRVAVPLLSELRALRDAGDPAAANLAYVLLWRLGLMLEGGGATIGAPEVPELLATLGSEPWWIDVVILTAAGPGPHDLERFLESLPEDTLFTTWQSVPIDEQLAKRLIAHAGASSNKRAVEACACALARAKSVPADEMPPIPKHDDPYTRSYAAYVALMLGDRTVSARDLGGRFAASVGAVGDPGRAQRDDSEVGMLLESDNAASSPGWDDFLAGYAERAPRTWSVHHQLDRLMNEALSRRLTPLADRSVWRDLALFEPHPLALAGAVHDV